MDRIQKPLLAAIAVSEISHIFCCVLPTLFSVLSLVAGLGLISSVPSSLTGLHDVVHAYEIPMIITSGIILAFGWLIYAYSRKIDCHDTGCEHEPCAPKKKKAHIILKLATLLFIINVSVYTTFHAPNDPAALEEDVHSHHGHDH